MQAGESDSSGRGEPTRCALPVPIDEGKLPQSIIRVVGGMDLPLIPVLDQAVAPLCQLWVGPSAGNNQQLNSQLNSHRRTWWAATEHP